MDSKWYVALRTAAVVILGLFLSLSLEPVPSGALPVAVEVGSSHMDAGARWEPTRHWAVAAAGYADGRTLDICPGGHCPVAGDGTALDDPDLDGLTNLQEIAAGTDPNNSDTDGGGENDGSEVLLFGQDPLDPADDEIQSIPWVHARPGISSAVLTFGVRTEYKRLRLYRRTIRRLGYDLVDSTVPPTGFYVDSGLVNGLTYYYRLMAVDQEGHRSRVSATVQVSPPGYLRAFLPMVQR